MNKKMTRIIPVFVLFLIAYHVVVFAFAFEKNAVFWVSYGFSMIAILLQIYIAYLAFNKATTPRSKFYGFPIIHLGMLYFGIQMIVGLIFMTLSSNIQLGIALVSQVIIVVIAITGIITSDSIRETIQEQDNQLDEETKMMKTLYNEMITLICKAKGKEFEKNMQKIADEIRYSDPISSVSTSLLEKEMSNLILEIDNAISQKGSDDVKQLLITFLQMLEERNSVCKISK